MDMETKWAKIQPISTLKTGIDKMCDCMEWMQSAKSREDRLTLHAFTCKEVLTEQLP